ncbi:transcription initiation factor IIB, partial [Candidatus Micrarchaeota archaeon CG10_big_fil_rev_8_21_14_0_10_59_7]
MAKRSQHAKPAKRSRPLALRPAAKPRGAACPDCGGRSFANDAGRGELVCRNCGLVIEDNMIQEGPEWRAFDAEQRATRARTGAPLKYMNPNKGLVTEIDQYNRDTSGVKIAPSQQAQLYRMRKWHKRASISNSIERNLAIALTELNRVASHLGLQENVRESAALLYRKCVEKGLIRGRQIESVVSAVIYAICRQYGIPRTLDEISNVAEIPKKEIGRTYRLIAQQLKLKVPLTNPQFYITRFVTSLHLSGETQKKAQEILEQALVKGLISGRGPMGVAAAAVYIASVLTGERRTQKEVADVAGVTEVTIRNRYRELKKALQLK